MFVVCVAVSYVASPVFVLFYMYIVAEICVTHECDFVVCCVCVFVFLVWFVI